MRQYSNSSRRRNEPSVDNIPELSAYADTGCEVSPSCLRCPLPQCKYDDPIWYQQYRRQGRDLRVLTAQQSEGATVFQLAEQFGVSQRTILRALRRAQFNPEPIERMPLAVGA